MRYALAVLMMCLWTLPSHAQQSIESLCEELSNYMPIDGVEFNPGATEVPADINRIQDPLFGSISIPVEIDLVEYFDRPELQMVQGLNLEPDVANIEINQDGSVYYNGQEITDDIQRRCGTPVPAVKEMPAKPAPPATKPKTAAPKPKAKPKIKPKVKPKAAPKKSSVKVFNGPNAVITDRSEVAVEKVLEQSAQKEPKKASKKPTVVDDNSIDVEDLNAQDNKDETINGDSDDDGILEGQYP